MSTSRRAAGALTIATAALVLAACGSSSSDTLSKSDLAAKANAICKDYNAKSKAVPQATANDAAQIAANTKGVREVRNNLVSSRNRGFLGMSGACFTAHRQLNP